MRSERQLLKSPMATEKKRMMQMTMPLEAWSKKNDRTAVTNSRMSIGSLTCSHSSFQMLTLWAARSLGP